MKYRKYRVRTFSLFIIVVLSVILISACEQSKPRLVIDNADDEALAEVPLLSEEEAPLPFERFLQHEQVSLFAKAPILDESELPEEAPHVVRRYGRTGDTYTYMETWQEWLIVQDEHHGIGRIPQWYASEQAADVSVAPISRLTLKPDVSLHLYPDSQWRTPAPANKALYALYRWADWIAVAYPSERWHDGENMYKPLLVWVHASDLAMHQPLTGGVWKIGSAISTLDIRSLTEILLGKETTKAEVEDWLGTPTTIETSQSLNNTGEPLELGEAWRYEREDGQLVVVFSYAGQLQALTWHLPMEEELKLASEQYYLDPIGYKFRVTQMPASVEKQFEWRNRGTLAYTYLEGVGEDVLLIRGDDGGYSGMHYDASMYAVDRLSGETIWQIDAGFGSISAFIDETRQYATIYTPYDPQSASYRKVVRHIRLADGEVIWHQERKGDELWMAGAEGVIVMYRPFYSEQQGAIVALDVKSGKELWSLTYDVPFQVHYTSRHEPVLVVQVGHELHGLSPHNGEQVWRLAMNQAMSEEERLGFHPAALVQQTPFEATRTTQWFRWGEELLHLDLRNGQVNARYEVAKQEFVHIIDERHLLLSQVVDADEYWNGGIFSTSLYDAVAARTVWTIPGRTSSVLADDNRLYAALDGIPTALDRASGQIIWTTAHVQVDTPVHNWTTVLSVNPLLVSVSDEWHELDPANGQVLGRWGDMSVSFPDNHERYISNGLINRDGEDLYIGSSNGYFSKIRITTNELD